MQRQEALREGLTGIIYKPIDFILRKTGLMR
jgi:hypothetical protein